MTAIGYSARSAIIGSTRVARRAGTSVATSDDDRDERRDGQIRRRIACR